MKWITLFAGFIVLSVSCSANFKMNEEPQNQWLVEFSSDDIGMVRAVMYFEFGDTTFQAATREGADRDIVGFWTALLGRTFTSDFKHGSLLRIIKGRARLKGDTLHLAGVFISAMGHYSFRGKVCNSTLSGELYNRRKKLKGTLKGKKQVATPPLADYPALFEEARKETLQKIYDPAIAEQKEWKKFTESMKRVAPKVQDDLEMVFAFFYYARQLPFSHYAMIKVPDQDEQSEEKSFVQFKEHNAHTAYLKITSFEGSAEEMNSVMMQIIKGSYTHLIVDLRKNPGGTVAAGLTFANRVIDSTRYGGVFLTQRWFNKHDEAPQIKDYGQLPRFTEANYDLIIQGIHQEEGLCLQLTPQEERFEGKLIILVDGQTASTCEPLVYGLKQYGLATVVGETTAGAMLNGEKMELSHDFSLYVPTATYYTADGYLIDGQGVKPDIQVDSKEALQYVEENLLK